MIIRISAYVVSVYSVVLIPEDIMGSSPQVSGVCFIRGRGISGEMRQRHD